jgi:hypothetical protein
MADNNKFNAMRARDFFRIHPLVMMSAPPGGGGGGARVIKGDPLNAQASVGSGTRILYANIDGLRTYQNLPLTWTPLCRKPVRVTIGGGVGIPLFHLPYNNDENYRITLNDQQGIGNVNLFLTEFVDGCSVYVEGTRQNPTVYHINAKSTLRAWSVFSPLRVTESLRRAADWQAKYDRMDDRFKNDGAKPHRVIANVGLSQATKVENHDYMLGPDQEGPVIGQLATYQAHGRVPLNHKGQTVDRIVILACQGSVFGERDPGAGTWKFYIQKRVLIGLYHNGTPMALDYQWLILSVEQFWPNAKTGSLVV